MHTATSATKYDLEKPSAGKTNKVVERVCGIAGYRFAVFELTEIYSLHILYARVMNNAFQFIYKLLVHQFRTSIR